MKKERKKLQFRIPFILNPDMKIPKKIAKKFKKMKKLNSGIISIQIGLTEAKKERKKLESRIPFLPEPGKKIPKKKAKKFKKLKNLFPALI